MKTRQEIFDIAYRGLASQGFLSSADEAEDTCLYRDGNGRKCAVGWCIPDDAYRSVWEEVGVDDENAIGAQIRRAAGIGDNNISFAKDLQWAHDKSTSPEGMKAGLAKVAAGYGLRIPEVSP